jgi:hypothetical protein
VDEYAQIPDALWLEHVLRGKPLPPPHKCPYCKE